MDWGPRVTYLASTAFKDRVVPFGIKDLDRQKHVCVVGKVGSGRGNLLSRMALQDIERGIGTLIIDASGNLAPIIMERLTKDELERLVHIDAADAEYPFSWNIPNEFRHTERGPDLFSEALASLYGIVRSPLTDFFGKVILGSPERTVLTAFTLASDEKERATLIGEGRDAETFAALQSSHAADLATLVENGKFLVKDTMVRNVLGQRDGKFSLQTLKEGSIFVLDLSRIRIFPTRVQPLARLFMCAFRAQMDGVTTGTLYLHDALRYFTESDADALLKDQSYALTLSDTVYKESDMPLREKALAQCGSVVTFAPHQSDIPLVQRVFYPYVTPEELQGLEPGEACVLLTIDANRARPFFANTLELGERKSVSLQDILVESRKKYTMPRTQVDELFKKQLDSEKKKNQPPFNDAFKNIFAKRDPANFMSPGSSSKSVTDTPKQGEPETKKDEPAATAAPSAPAPAPIPEVKVESVREISESDLRELVFVNPLPI